MLVEKNKLKNPIAEGGEGIIYKSKKSIYKIFKSHIDMDSKKKKIDVLMSFKGRSASFPTDIIYDNNNKFIGYSMDVFDGDEIKRLGNKKFRKANKIDTVKVLKLLVAIELALTKIHKNGVVVGDLNDSNILFDKYNNICFIDTDSWSVAGIDCDVAMETFKDPLLTDSHFSKETDWFSFAILTFKMLANIHPFGGTTNPDMNIVERIKRRRTLIGNDDVRIPKFIGSYEFISPILLHKLKEIFESKLRISVGPQINDFLGKNKHCKDCNSYYYADFDSCPICNKNAEILRTPVKVDSKSKIPYVLMFENDDISMIINKDIYLSDNGMIKSIPDKIGIYKYETGIKFYKTKQVKKHDLIVSTKSNFTLHGNLVKKQYNSDIIVNNDKIYYHSLSGTLVEISVFEGYTSETTLAHLSINSMFKVVNRDVFAIVNMYDNYKVINISGYMQEIRAFGKIVDWSFHHDDVTGNWLYITEDDKGIFNTYIMSKYAIEYHTNKIKYHTSLNNLDLNNNIIFIPEDKKIRGFSYKKNIYKDFDCEIVTGESNIKKHSKYFSVINEKEIYRIG